MQKSVIFAIFNGLLHGSVIGILLGFGVYLLGVSVQGLGFLNISPTALAGLMFATGVLAGMAKEYNDWVFNKNNGGQ